MLAKKILHPKLKRTRTTILNPKVPMPLSDLGYEQSREFSQFRNGYHAIYKALHALNILTKEPVSSAMVYALLQLAPKSGGRASFISRNTVSCYLGKNQYNLWRRIIRTTPATSSNGGGHRGYLYVANGLSVDGRKLKAR
jgi:hypothetical protein